MLDWFHDIDYLPRGAVYFWDRGAIIADATASTGCVLVCVVMAWILLYASFTRQSIIDDKPMQRIYWGQAVTFLFGAVIFSLDVTTLWVPIYRLRIAVKVLAVIVGTGIILLFSRRLSERVLAREQKEKAMLQKINEGVEELSKTVSLLAQLRSESPQEMANIVNELDRIIRELRALRAHGYTGILIP